MIAMTARAPDSLARHFGRTVALAVPIILARAALVVMFSVDTLMVGRISPEDLAYFGLGVAPQLTLMLIGVGALQASSVLTAQAIGAGRIAEVGNVFRTSIAHALAMGVAVLGLSLLAGPFFLAVGQAPDLAAGAATVSLAFGAGMPGTLLFIACNLFMESTGRPKTGMAIMLGANLVNVPLNLVFGFGWGGLVPPMGADGVMLASSIARTAAGVTIAGVLVVSALRIDNFRILSFDSSRGPGLAGLVCLFRSPEAAGLRRMGLPMGLAQGVESAAFATVVMFAGLIGTVELAAYQTTMTLVTLTFMMAIGTAGATAIRVGRAYGETRSTDMRIAGWAGIALGGLWPLPVAICFLVSPETAARLVTDDPVTVAAASEALFVAGLMLSVDAMMAVALGALRGMGDVWWPTMLQIAAFWCVAIPVAYIGGLVMDLGAGALIGGLLAGILVSLAGLLWRFHRATRGKACNVAGRT
ncbi:MATE family efflux transporter [Stappia stellulata]|uniref:MATE family efflux transporter n=1 Tax=Stappia stellulata TaxID=71235 RepID=UPI00040D846A|nr:MATE family efflux transporter [Stappia stellulata]